MSDDSEIQVEDLCTEKKFFSQIPNIIHKMGLGPYVVSYYCLLKSIAGDKNTCFMSQKNLSRMLGCSDRQIRLMNDFMSRPFEILGGKPLIKVTQRKDENGENLPNLVQVVDIWVENILVLKDKKTIPQTPMPKKERDIKKNISAEYSSTPVEYSSTPAEPGSYKEEPKYNTTVKKSYIKDLGQETKAFDKSNNKNLDASRRWGLTEEQKETFEALKSLNIDAEDKKLCFWAKTYTLKRLLEVYNESKHHKAQSLRKYMSSLLEGNKQVPNANSEANKQFAIDFIKQNPWPKAKIYKKYLKYPLGNDFGEIDFNMDSQDFIYRLMEKHENSND